VNLIRLQRSSGSVTTAKENAAKTHNNSDPERGHFAPPIPKIVSKIREQELCDWRPELLCQPLTTRR
jgi:hypothetical protein